MNSAGPATTTLPRRIDHAPLRKLVAIAALLVGVFVALDVFALGAWRNTSTASAINVGSLGVGLAHSAISPSPGPRPLAIDIPSIRVHSSLVDLHLRGDGSLAVPDEFSKVGWWADATAPGDPGAAVMVGHVDSFKGAAVFYHLRELTVGADVIVHRADGSVATFTVQALREYAKAAFPATEIYGSTGVPTLRLITCGGTFDRRRNRYSDNVVAFARLASAPSRAARRSA